MDTNDISVIIQGPIYAENSDLYSLRRCIGSVRSFLPGAEVILSTWTSEVNGDLLPYIEALIDKLHLIRLPEEISSATISNNIHRQFISTSAGLRIASRPYALKIRANFWFTGFPSVMLKDYGDKLVTLMLCGSMKDSGIIGCLPDFIMLGPTDVLLKIWSFRWNTDNIKELNFWGLLRTLPLWPSRYKLLPEQCLGIAAMRAYGFTNVPTTIWSSSPAIISDWCQFLSQHITMIPMDKAQITSSELRYFQGNFMTDPRGECAEDALVIWFKTSIYHRFRYILSTSFLQGLAKALLYYFSPELYKRVKNARRL